MVHFDWIMNNYFVVASDRTTLSLLFYADGDLCCEINGYPFSCKNEGEFWDLVEQFDDKNVSL